MKFLNAQAQWNIQKFHYVWGFKEFRIQGISICGIPKLLDMVKFLNSLLHLSINKFYQKAKEMEFLNSQRSFEAFQVIGILKCLPRNKPFANTKEQDVTSWSKNPNILNSS